MQTVSSLVLTAVLIAVSITDAESQRRTTYESLLQRSGQPSSYIDEIQIPVADSTSIAAFTFRLEYDLVPFFRIQQDMNPPGEKYEYFAPVRMGLEVFKGKAGKSKKSDQQSVSHFRDNLQDTVWAENFEITKSRDRYIQGVLTTEINHGPYHYELQLSRAGSVREQASNRRDLNIPKYSDSEKAIFIIAKNIDSGDSDYLYADLLNYGNNVLYGQDFNLLVILPPKQGDADESFTVTMKKLVPGSDGDKPQTVPVATFQEEIQLNHILHASDIDIFKDSGIVVSMKKSDSGTRFATLSVPNSNFENSRYKLEITRNDDDSSMGEKIINSQWLDMPVSLLNLDVSVDMLRFMVGDDRVKKMKSGTQAEREEKFRAFWEQRDPTPDTEFNELMAEYYRRIDYAFRNFSSMQFPGYETDQGKAYITLGEPDNINRRLRTDGPTREIWEYPNRTLIFEATSGFGDFKLIAEN